MSHIISVKNLTHTYSQGTPFERCALDGVDLDIEKGEFLGLIGHTGSGKSTLIQHLNGLLKPTSGEISLDGKNIWAEPSKIRRVRFRVGLVFQYPEYQLFEETVYKDIAFGPKNMGMNEAQIRETVMRAIEFVGLSEDVLDKSPFELSGGQKRRVAIAGVISMDPEVLILDEPTAGLDPRGRDDILSQLSNYHKKKRNTVILVTHSMDEIAKTVQRIVVMNRARVMMQGSLDEVFSRVDEIKQAGLSVPQVTQIFLNLKQSEIDINTSVYTIEQAKKCLLQKKEACRHA